MKQKTILVIILAGILAFLSAFAIIKINQPKPTPTIEPKKEEIIIPTPEAEPVKAIEQETKQEPISKPTTPAIKKVSYTKPAQQPAKVEAPKLEPIVVKEAEAEAEPIQNEGVVKEENSNDIVITREYKIQSPSKYTFK